MKASKAFPGVISPELKEALDMAELSPPPWLINMQRYGPPPSYPSLKIPGLNAPIPPGTEFGYHPGGWGKPPVDMMGQPLYGDVFGVNYETEDDIDIEVRHPPCHLLLPCFLPHPCMPPELSRRQGNVVKRTEAVANMHSLAADQNAPLGGSHRRRRDLRGREQRRGGSSA